MRSRFAKAVTRHPGVTQASGGLPFKGLEPAAAGNEAFRAIKGARLEFEPEEALALHGAGQMEIRHGARREAEALVVG